MKNINSYDQLQRSLRRHSSHAAELQQRLKHLNSAIGSQMRVLNNTLSKISGHYSDKETVPDKLSSENSDLLPLGILRQTIGSFGSTVVRQNVGNDSWSSASRQLSQRQITAQLASAISRAVSRDL